MLANINVLKREENIAESDHKSLDCISRKKAKKRTEGWKKTERQKTLLAKNKEIKTYDASLTGCPPEQHDGACPLTEIRTVIKDL